MPASGGSKKSWVLCLLQEEAKRSWVLCLLQEETKGVGFSVCFRRKQKELVLVSTPGMRKLRGAEEEEAPAPNPAPVPLRQHSQLDQLVERFDLNRLVHGDKEDCLQVIEANVISFASSSFNYDLITVNWDSNQLRLFSSTWNPPPPTEWIKLNVDASLHKDYTAGIGGVIRGSKGRFLFAFGFKRIHWDIMDLEMKALLP
ncbi:hypothetical protein MA16_Dca020522 [Dendrobium catenatum]|uniref:RNase H type-1 domain-containing protein n=1 Tax=Dendrobium catenatum TaxID=906689 RepID=A0A2I0XA83_9ASPA|nr:hypothetical protein MA16_Dca020522 [Dendrobium catenatum]